MSTERLGLRVAQAQGMVSAQIQCTVDEALVIMRERALVQHQTLADVADAVLKREIRFGL
jgi:AmiR/NasT family two-component response regulator